MYTSPFSERYASPEMSHLFSGTFKISTFRKLWLSLAKAQKKLGLSITPAQIAELAKHTDTIDFAKAAAYEKKFRHDVMAHIHAFGDDCPKAKAIIHLGATSTFVTDNTDLIQLKSALTLLSHKLIQILRHLAAFAEKEAASPCLAYTHFQPAQPTTFGKRASLWLQDFLFDAQNLHQALQDLPFLGAKGATGTQASFLTLFDNNGSKVKELERLIAHDFGFTMILPIAGQTYTRKIDIHLVNLLQSFAASAHKMATDLRLLAHTGELFETPSDTQVGSSAMPYKRNPIYSERICGLARFLISLSQNPAYTLATQWLERSLDDSSNRRLAIPESFLAADALCNLLLHLLTNLTVNHSHAKSLLEEALPHLCMENILMLAAKKGADRQEVHEKLRKLSKKPLATILKELKLDPKSFSIDSLIGRAPEQTKEFLSEYVRPFLAKHKKVPTLKANVEI